MYDDDEPISRRDAVKRMLKWVGGGAVVGGVINGAYDPAAKKQAQPQPPKPPAFTLEPEKQPPQPPPPRQQGTPLVERVKAGAIGGGTAGGVIRGVLSSHNWRKRTQRANPVGPTDIDDTETRVHIFQKRLEREEQERQRREHEGRE